jgi:regulation of enolase protein 1 (concanavalin A-like superfamily)
VNADQVISNGFFLEGKTMIRIAVTGIAFFCASALLASAAAQEKKPLAISGWGTVVDPDADCQVKVKKEKLTITVPKTHHDLTYTDEYTKLNAPRILQNTKGDFRIRVKVKAFPLPAANASSGGRYSFVSSGLLIWQDGKNFIRMDRAAVGGLQEPFIWVERFEDGKAVSQKQQKIENTDTYLRITRKGNKLIFESSEDGKKWSEVYTEHVKMPQEVETGVLAINTTTSAFVVHLKQFKRSGI